MRERTPQSMLRWISRHYNMSTADLARMFQRNQRTIHAWMKEGRISVRNGSRIRTSFYFLTGEPDPHRSERSPIDMM
ncbi:MAG TPA: hypothetical protein VL354_02920 [Spirochaetia bacterium]|nr:hypothetical protein [Spirochaetia bacterium]